MLVSEGNCSLHCSLLNLPPLKQIPGTKLFPDLWQSGYFNNTLPPPLSSKMNPAEDEQTQIFRASKFMFNF